MLKTIASTILIASLFTASADAQGMSGSSSTSGGQPSGGGDIVIDVLRGDVDRMLLIPYGRDVKWEEGAVTVSTSKGKVKADLQSGAVTFEGGGIASLIGTVSGGGDSSGNGNATITLGMGPGDFTASTEVLVRRSVKLSDLPGDQNENKLAAVTMAIVASLSQIEQHLQRFSLANQSTASTSAGTH